MHAAAPCPPAAGLVDAAIGEMRAATRPHHQRIEQLLALDAPMPLPRYTAILQGFQRFLGAWEAELHQALPEAMQDWLTARSRLALLHEDLAWLGAAHQASPAGAVPRCLPDNGLPSAFGSLYVIEGSALGGQVITPRLQRDLGLAPGRGASYFHGHGERTAGMWREFRQLAGEAIGTDAGRRQQACRAAGQTFEVLISTFEPLLA